MGKTIQSEQGSAVEDDVADLDHPLQADELSFVHFIATEQFGFVAKVAQKPVQLPQGFRAAIETTRKDVAGKSDGLKDGQSESVVGLLCLSTKLDTLHPNEENPVGDLVGGAAIGGVQSVDPPQAAFLLCHTDQPLRFLFPVPGIDYDISPS
jgi:hypothetical protein